VWGTFFHFFARFLCLLVPSSAFVALHVSGRVVFACHGDSPFFDCILFFAGSVRRLDRSSRLDGLNRCELLASATACLRCDTLSRSSKLFGSSRSVSRTVHPRLLRGQWCGAAPCGVCSIRPYFLFTPRCRVRRNTLLFQGTVTCKVISL